MAIVDELITSLGVSINHDVSTKIAQFKSLIGGVTKNVTRLSLALGAAGGTAFYFIQRTSAQAQEMENLSKQTGVSTESLQSWAYAATKAGVSAQNVQSDIVRLQRKWGMFGLDATKQMERLANSFSKMSPKRAVFYGGMFGLSPDTVLLLQRGKDALEKFRKEAEESGAIISKENIERAAQFNRTLQTLRYILNSLIRQIAIAAMPALTKLADKIRDLVKENRKWLEQKTEQTMEGLSGALERVSNLYDKLKDKVKPVTDALKDFTPEMKWAEGVMRLVSAALVLLIPKLIAMSAPILGTVAAIALLAIVIDDLLGYIEKGDSALGPFIEKLGKIGESLGDKLYDWFPQTGTSGPSREDMRKSKLFGFLFDWQDKFQARNDKREARGKFNEVNREPGSLSGSFGEPEAAAIVLKGLEGLAKNQVSFGAGEPNIARGKLNPSGPYTDNRKYEFNFGPLPQNLSLPQLSLQVQLALEQAARMNAPQRIR